MPAQTTIQVRRGTASSWTSTNPTLAAGEVGFETDTGKFKIGTGSAVWTSLSYFNPGNTSPLTTKGDLYTYSTTDARLAVGANGYTLVADSSTSTGLAYGSSALANPIINGGMDIWQRGTSGFVPGNNATTFAADRWNIQRGVTGSTVSRQATNDTTNLPDIQYCMRVQRDSGNTSTSTIGLATSLESVNAIPFAGKTVTLSFYARAGANYSASSSALNAELRTGTGTDQNTFSTYTGSATPISSNVTLTTTWQRFSLSATLATTTTEFALKFTFTPVGTAGANDYYEITGVQIDLGSTALPFRRSGGTIQGELAAAQRYFYGQTIDGATTGVGNFAALGTADGTTTSKFPLRLPVTMRTAPSLTFSSQTGFRLFDFVNASTTTNAISLYASSATNDAVTISASVASGLTQYRPYALIAPSSGTSYIYASSEL